MPILTNKYARRLSYLLIADALVFGFTNSQAVPAFCLIIGFVLLTATIYYIAWGLIGLSRFYGIQVKHRRRLAWALTFLTAILVALQSIGELNRLDIIVLLPLLLVGYLYSSYGKSNEPA